VSHFYLAYKESTSKKTKCPHLRKRSKKQLPHSHTQMALFAAIGDRFISRILKQVANDYNLDFEEMKARYCGESSLEEWEPVKPKGPKVPAPVHNPNVLEVDLEAPPVKVPKPKAPAKPKAPKVPKPHKAPTPDEAFSDAHVYAPAPDPKVLMALSKMKKPDLVAECDERGLDSEGTVAQLKDRVKEARESDPAATKGKTKGKAKAPKADPKPKKVPPPPPPPIVPLEEEVVEEEEGDPDKEFEIGLEEEFEEDDTAEEEDDLQARLRKILAEAEEEEFEEEEEV
jgi:hypothetical protein